MAADIGGVGVGVSTSLCTLYPPHKYRGLMAADVGGVSVGVGISMILCTPYPPHEQRGLMAVVVEVVPHHHCP
jgi:exosome complex RNA-binding protein Rrp42 (RNase PH superfamily)